MGKAEEEEANLPATRVIVVVEHVRRGGILFSRSCRYHSVSFLGRCGAEEAAGRRIGDVEGRPGAVNSAYQVSKKSDCTILSSLTNTN